jgi:hypothetical protein
MENFKRTLYLLLLVTVIFSSCTKENITTSTQNDQQTPGISQSLIYNNITIDPSADHVFSIPNITRSVIDKGSITVYAASAFSQTTQWQVLNSCEAHMDITSIAVGSIQIKNNEASAVSMSFRFDITGN